MPILQGKWVSSHLEEHRRMFDNLCVILSDLEHSDVVLPRNENGVILWNQISVEFLINFALLNATKVTHKHTEESA
jgi:hypothetical protein